jgi:hypothetical protein
VAVNTNTAPGGPITGKAVHELLALLTTPLHKFDLHWKLVGCPRRHPCSSFLSRLTCSHLVSATLLGREIGGRRETAA